MDTDNTTTAPMPEWMRKRRDAMVAEQERIIARDYCVSDIIRGKGGRDQVGEIVAVEDGDGSTTGAFAAEVTHRGETTWQAVSNGTRSPAAWYTREGAVLHLLAVRYGDGDDLGTAAGLAARVIGISTDKPAERTGD